MNRIQRSTRAQVRHLTHRQKQYMLQWAKPVPNAGWSKWYGSDISKLHESIAVPRVKKATYQQPIPDKINHQVTDTPQHGIPLRGIDVKIREFMSSIDHHLPNNDTVCDIGYAEKPEDYEADYNIGKSLFSQWTRCRVEDGESVDAEYKLYSCNKLSWIHHDEDHEVRLPTVKVSMCSAA